MRMKKVLCTLKRAVLPSAAIALCVTATVAAYESFPPFFEKITTVCAAVAMPQGGVAVLKSELFKDDTAVSENTDTKTEEISKKTEETENVISEITPDEPFDEIASYEIIKAHSTKNIPSGCSAVSEYTFLPAVSSNKIISCGGAYFSNTSKVSNADILKVLEAPPEIKLEKNKPTVLIYHTHSTESYESEDLGYYKSTSSARTTDLEKNMIRVGDAICMRLEAAGIEVIHDRSIYDYPSYNGAYYRSADKVREYLKKYPSITVTLDIHRDAIEQTGGVRVKPTAVINGKKAAQVMIIAGVDDGTMDFPLWRENMKFASALQKSMETHYPTLTRPAMVCHRRYNMYLTSNSLLIEVGGHANTLSEAVYSGEMIGTSLARIIKENGVY